MAGFFMYLDQGKEVPAYVYTFLYLMWAIVCAQAIYAALLASWQEGHYNNITTAWSNAALIFGVVILVWIAARWSGNNGRSADLSLRA